MASHRKGGRRWILFACFWVWAVLGNVPLITAVVACLVVGRLGAICGDVAHLAAVEASTESCPVLVDLGSGLAFNTRVGTGSGDVAVLHAVVAQLLLLLSLRRRCFLFLLIVSHDCELVFGCCCCCCCRVNCWTMLSASMAEKRLCLRMSTGLGVDGYQV